MRITFIGPPASGKGTQAELLAQKLKLPLISSGNLFRQHIKDKTELGQRVEKTITEGNLVSDEITNQVMAEEIKKKLSGFVLDGYPRNLNQAEYLKKMTKLDVVFEIWISEKEAIRRLSGRRVCQCGATYHLIFKPPKKEGICDLCRAKLFPRNDDSEKKIKYRFQIYRQETEPLVDFYQSEKILIKINGEQPIKNVFREIIKKISCLKIYKDRYKK